PDRGAVVHGCAVPAATVGSGGERLTDFAALRREGAVAFTDDGKPMLHDGLMRQALLTAAEWRAPVIQHAEDTALTRGAVMNYGPRAFRMGLRGMPAEAEWRIVWRDIQLAAETGADVHVAHVSTAGAINAIREGRRRGVHVTCEVTPHHFALIDDDIQEYDANWKMNPPLRSAEDREALIGALLDGTADAIATDHAPHAIHEKRVEFDRAPFGIIGLDTALGLAIKLLHKQRGIPLPRIVDLLAANPARILSGSEQLHVRGTLKRSAPADRSVF